MQFGRTFLTVAVLAAGSILAIGAAAAQGDKANVGTQPADALAKDLTVDEIVNRANHVSYYQGKDGRAEVKMTITDASKQKRTREFTILRRDADAPGEGEGDASQAKNLQLDRKATGEQKFYVYFSRPADVNKTAFLVWKHLDKDDDRWLYLPALDLVKRISAGDKRTSFVGSNFFYEDVSGRNIDLDRHELVPEETNATYYVLKNTPKDPSNVEFAYYKMWIHRSSFVVVQTSYYDRNDKEYRRYNAMKVENVEGYPTVVKSAMSNLSDGSNTILEYSNVDYNAGLPEDIFEERYLRRPPVRFIR